MIEHRFEIEAGLEDGMSELRVDGGALQLVTVCLGETSSALGEAVVRPPVVSCLRPGRGGGAGVLALRAGGAADGGAG